MKPTELTQEQLINEVVELAQSAKSNNLLGDFYSISSNAKVIASNAKNESALIKLGSKINKLTSKIDEYNINAANQADKLIKLTWAIVGLTILMLIGLIIQLIK